jgi:hypothetical protein
VVRWPSGVDAPRTVQCLRRLCVGDVAGRADRVSVVPNVVTIF